MSGRPDKDGLCVTYRNPCACSAFRNVTSGPVFRVPTLAMMRLRTVFDTLSPMADTLIRGRTRSKRAVRALGATERPWPDESLLYELGSSSRGNIATSVRLSTSGASETKRNSNWLEVAAAAPSTRSS
jgi:hypothetical protein